MREHCFKEWKIGRRRFSIAVDLLNGVGLAASIVKHPPEMSFEPYVTPWTEFNLTLGPLSATLTSWNCSYEAKQADR